MNNKQHKNRLEIQKLLEKITVLTYLFRHVVKTKSKFKKKHQNQKIQERTKNFFI